MDSLTVTGASEDLPSHDVCLCMCVCVCVLRVEGLSTIQSLLSLLWLMFILENSFYFSPEQNDTQTLLCSLSLLICLFIEYLGQSVLSNKIKVNMQD